MKLKNKKTGEIKEVIVGGYPVSGETKMWECSEMDINEETGYKTLGTYTSLAKLNEEWEDVPEEEPKVYWYIMSGGETRCIEDIDNDYDHAHKEIGNYFETKEEAEKAVEKLKAWKRLRDKGFRFSEFAYTELCDYARVKISATMINDSINEDLELLFGGKE